MVYLKTRRQPVGVERVGDAEHRRLEVLAAERGLPVNDRERRHRDQADADVDHHDDDGRAADQALERRAARGHLGRQPRGRLQPGEDHGRHAEGEDDVAPLRRHAEVDRVNQLVVVEERGQPDDDQRQLQADVGDDQRADPVDARLGEAADVAQRDVQDDPEREDQLGAAVPEVAPEGGHVVRRRERGDRDQDDVVEQDRPAGDEADELVEAVAGKDRRARPLGMQRGALDVGHRRQGEEQPRDEEDQRRQAERVVGDDAEREVDRAGDRRVDDRKQRRLSQPLAEHGPLSAPAARGWRAAC